MIDSVVVIPALNPTDKLGKLVEDLIAAKFKRIVLVDDGSDMQYWPIFEKIALQSECVVLKHAVNLGKGRALKTAFNYILAKVPEAKCIITVDADGQHQLPDIEKVRSAYDGGKQLVLGSRQFSRDANGKKVPLRSKLGNQITKMVFNFLCGISISDTQTGLRAYPCEILSDLMDVKGERYDYETNCLLWCHDNDVSFKEIVIKTIYEDNNKSSHFNPLKDSLRIYGIIFKYICSSGLAVLVDYAVFLLLSGFTNNCYLLVYSGRACSAIINFTVNQKVVFKNSGNIKLQAVKCIILLLFSGTLSAIMLSWLAGIYQWNLLGAKIVVETVLFFINFYVQKRFIFTKG